MKRLSEMGRGCDERETIEGGDSETSVDQRRETAAVFQEEAVLGLKKKKGIVIPFSLKP